MRQSQQNQKGKYNLRSLLRLLTVTLLISFVPSLAWACACCSHEGEYYRGSGKIADYEMELIKEMRFGDSAILFTSEADIEDMATGIINPKDNYKFNGSLAGRVWKLTFRDGPNVGSLSFSMPFRMQTLKFDLRNGEKSGGGGPLLYKEWRLEGMVNGTGIFRPGLVGPTRYSLIFQGRGNSCDNAGDFNAWRLEVKGKKADYAFYGDMKITN